MTEIDSNKKNEIIWIHNFPKKVGEGGGWMYNQHEFLKDDVDLYYLDNLRNPVRFVQHCVTLRKLSKNYKIAHAQYGSAVGFITSLMKCKRIVSLKGSDWYKNPDTSLIQKIRIALGNKLTSFSLKRFHHIIVMSDAMKRQVKQQFPKANLATIVDPIDLDRFKPLDLPIENETKKILFASVNLANPIKRFDLAKKSFEVLQRKMPDSELISMSKIPHEEVCNFMNGVDILLLTSTHEGWPNVVKEMLACNKPFVSTDVSDLRALAEKTKSCQVCNDSPEDLGEALFKSLKAEKEDLRKFVKEFSMEQTLAVIKGVYAQYM